MFLWFFFFFRFYWHFVSKCPTLAGRFGTCKSRRQQELRHINTMQIAANKSKQNAYIALDFNHQIALNCCLNVFRAPISSGAEFNLFTRSHCCCCFFFSKERERRSPIDRTKRDKNGVFPRFPWLRIACMHSILKKNTDQHSITCLCQSSLLSMWNISIDPKSSRETRILGQLIRSIINVHLAYIQTDCYFSTNSFISAGASRQSYLQYLSCLAEDEAELRTRVPLVHEQFMAELYTLNESNSFR